MSRETFEMVAHAMSPLAGHTDLSKTMPPRDKPQPKRKEPELSWEQFEELPHGVLLGGWILHVGYLPEWDDDHFEIYIHRAYLSTGQRDIELQLAELPLNDLEALLSEGEEMAARAAAEDLAHDDDDRGDWLYEARKDREALR